MSDFRRALNKTNRERPLEFTNGLETMRTMFLHELHRRVGLCSQCGATACFEHSAGSKLPATIRFEDVVTALNDVAERYGQPRI